MQPNDWIACGVCGDKFDPSDLSQVVYHENNPHRPILALPTFESKRIK